MNGVKWFEVQSTASNEINWRRVISFLYAEIDIEADLQFRAFLNAPKEYRWFAIDSDGRGFVYRNKPILDAHNNWLNEEFSGDICNVGASIGVGLFLQYAELFGKILIERKD